jgi:hypothetical protein
MAPLPMTFAQRVDRVVTAFAVVLLVMGASTAIYWVKKRPQTAGNVVVGKRVVIDETQGAAHVEYLLTVTTPHGKREEIAVRAEVYQRAAIGARIERRGAEWVVKAASPR